MYCNLDDSALEKFLLWDFRSVLRMEFQGFNDFCRIYMWRDNFIDMIYENGL